MTRGPQRVALVTGANRGIGLAIARGLAAELAGTGILVNAASPGRTNTRMAYRETNRTPQEAADTPIWLATLPKGDTTTGGLFSDRRPLPW